MIVLNYRDPRPIYEQLEEKLRKLILTGVLATQSKLPSVRELAAELAVNPNTIQRAYRELESQGFIYTVPGKGSFVGPLSEVSESCVKELTEKFTAAATELLQLGVTREHLIELIGEDTQDD